MIDQIKWPDRVLIIGEMVLRKPSRIDREFRGVAREYQPGRIFGKVYVEGEAAKAEFEKIKSKVEDQAAEIERLNSLLELARIALEAGQ